MIEIKDLSVKYEKTYHNPKVVAISHLNATFDNGSFNVVVGPSGCGKTTLLRAIAGLVKCDGDIVVNKVNFTNIYPSDRNIGYVSQSYDLYPHLNVFDNIAFPLKNRGARKEEIIKTVGEIAEELDIRFLYTRKIKELSGGQAQRVALARAMVKKPMLYLFDEPLSNVASEYRDIERHIIKDNIKKYQATAIYVTHNIGEATALADKIFVMNEGQIIFTGTPREVLACKDPLVLDLFKEQE